MFKKSLSLLLCIALFQIAKAANTDTLTVFLKNSGQTVKSKDSADYYRFVLPPDSSVDKDLYQVFEYYPNGKLKAVATSLTKSVDLVLDGTYIEYFMNGTRKKTAIFKKGRFNGIQTKYYPNGKLYEITNFKDLIDRYYPGYLPGPMDYYKIQVVELRDSTGKLLVSNGTGHLLTFDEDFKKIIEEGDIKNNKLEGEWRGLIADSGRYICTFHKNELKSGISYMKSGHHYSFKNFEERAVFSDGNDAFFTFIKKNIKYPESAKKRKISGSVTVGFNVEINGTVSNVTVEKGVIKSLDDEAVRIIRLSPLWYSATQFGAPIRTHHSVSVYFDYDRQH
jgi:TonB family protein